MINNCEFIGLTGVSECVCVREREMGGGNGPREEAALM